MVTPFPGGLLPYISYIGLCGAKGYGFWAVLVEIGYVLFSLA